MKYDLILRTREPPVLGCPVAYKAGVSEVGERPQLTAWVENHVFVRIRIGYLGADV
jgi:hypothetical protein